ncbi:helicase [Campylobacter rectus]|uniref:helicase n=1 Tax=Campylobacter rectus TaxID=203 RepID=UPI0028DB1934|nr:helicase [Campylobacter rectus]
MKINGQLLNLQTHRKVAKIGMSVTLAAVCLTALGLEGRNKGRCKKLHTISGVAFVGFALYHAGLYDNGIFRNMIVNANKKNAEAKRLASDDKDK